MDLGLEALSKITVFSKYAKYIPELKRRETWDEIVDRYEAMMLKKYPYLEESIKESIPMIRNKKILPSMRALQFAGPAAEVTTLVSTTAVIYLLIAYIVSLKQCSCY